MISRLGPSNHEIAKSGNRAIIATSDSTLPHFRAGTGVTDTCFGKSRYPSSIETRFELKNLLEEERREFRASLPENAAGLWMRFTGRIAVVLSGGGARGAYEAG